MCFSSYRGSWAAVARGWKVEECTSTAVADSKATTARELGSNIKRCGDEHQPGTDKHVHQVKLQEPRNVIKQGML
uniref:Uncharacterized protein n=1 Tax=Oryza glumipatula TaxID=40148 RepID=A0A0D9YMJ4_9ORYZ